MIRAAFCLALVACAPEGPLVRADRWTLVDGTCSADAVSQEGDAIEIRTQTCSSATVEQPLGRALAKGTLIRADISHTSLTGDAAMARIAVTLGATTLEESFAVPTAAAIHTLQGTLAEDMAAGSTVRFAVANHGSNSYVLHSITAER